jgi:hypothetical protein
VMRLYGVKGPEIGEKIKELEAEKFILKLSWHFTVSAFLFIFVR